MQINERESVESSQVFLSPRSPREQYNLHSSLQDGVESQMQSSQSNAFDEALSGYQSRKLERGVQGRSQRNLKRSQFVRNSDQEVKDDIAPSKKYTLQKIIGLFKNVYDFKQNLLISAMILPKQPDIRKQIMFEKYIQQSSKQNEQSESQNQKSCFGLYIPVFYPTDFIVRVWEILGLILSLLMLWFYPFLMTFDVQHADIYNIIKTLFLVYALSDMIFQCNHAIIHHGQVITESSKIIKEYLKGKGMSQIIIIIYWSFMYQNQDVQHFSVAIVTVLVMILDIYRLFKRVSQIYESLYLRGVIQDVLDLILLITIVYFFAHIMACLFHFTAVSSQFLGTNWLITNGLDGENPYIQYNVAFYWSTMTMTTVGYGDITPSNHLEVLFCNIMMFLSSCIFAYSMNSIGMIVKNINESTLQYNNSLSLVNQYMKTHAVSLAIQSRVRNYLKYFMLSKFKENQGEVHIVIYQINEIVKNLPEGLQRDLNGDVKTKLINKISLFDSFSTQTKQQLAYEIEFIQFTPQEVIYRQNRQQEIFMYEFNHLSYYILEGQINIYEEKSNYSLQTLSKNKVFGEYQFITGCDSKSSAMSNDFSLICRISRESFMKQLQLNELDQQLYQKIYNEITFNKEFYYLQLTCNYCRRTNHLNIDCPLLGYKPKIERLKKAENFEVNDRFPIQRRKFRINVLNDYTSIMDCATIYRNNIKMSDDESNDSVLKLDDEIQDEESIEEASTPRETIPNEDIVQDNDISLQPSVLQQLSHRIEKKKQNQQNSQILDKLTMTSKEVKSIPSISVVGTISKQKKSVSGQSVSRVSIFKVRERKESQDPRARDRKESLDIRRKTGTATTDLKALKEPSKIESERTIQTSNYHTSPQQNQAQSSYLKIDEPLMEQFITNFDIDKVQNYTLFYPQYNLAKVLQKIEKYRPLNKAQQSQLEFTSQYMFYYLPKILSVRVRQQLKRQLNTNRKITIVK